MTSIDSTMNSSPLTTSVLRFVRAVGGWPGKVVVIACEPAEVDAMGFGLSEQVSAAVDGAVELVESTCMSCL